MDEEKRKVYDALGCLYIHAFRIAKATNQWTEQSTPYVTQDQIRELIETIHRLSVSLHLRVPQVGSGADLRGRYPAVHDALGCLFHLAYRLAKANSQWTDEAKDTPYLTLPQTWELIERVIENPSIDDSKNPPSYDIRFLGHVPRWG
jgi:hypothetical protein